MRTEVTRSEIEKFRANGFVVIPDFLTDGELGEWRDAVEQAVRERGHFLLPGRRWEEQPQTGQFHSPVLTQRINLWKTSPTMKRLLVNRSMGFLASQLSGMARVRLWADQTLVKQPFSPPTGYHLDTPFWSFSADQALTIWIALDDTTLENGAMCFIPGVHKERRFDQVDLGGKIGRIFEIHPHWAAIEPVFCPVRAGGCIFHNGLLAHGAAANMTAHVRRAMAAIFYPDGATFNGNQNVLSDEELARLEIGDLLNDDDANPLLYAETMPPRVLART
jgi:phytanoyl-CoA hydroxylase